MSASSSPRTTRLARSLLRRLFKLLLALPVRLLDGDPWERSEHDVPLLMFGTGSTRDFHAYFEGERTVVASSIDDICNWLLDCLYIEDEERFGVPDYWQHPAEFEARRRGDCDDHALWAWRKLCEIGVSAELVSGRARTKDGTLADHVWVQFPQDGIEYVLEAVATSRSAMIRPVGDARVRADYVRHFAVD